MSAALAKSTTGCIPLRASALLWLLRVIGTAATTGSRISNATSPIAFAFSTSAGMSVAGLNGRDFAPGGIASSIKWMRSRSAPMRIKRGTSVSAGLSSAVQIRTLPTVARVPSGHVPPDETIAAIRQGDRRLAGFRNAADDVKLAAREPIFPNP